jgi:hypothetical protein
MISVEACLFGAYPLLPNRLVYPELYPNENLYATEAQLVKKLKYFCSRPKAFRLMRLRQINLAANNKANKINFTSTSSTAVQSPEHSCIDSANYFDKFKWISLKNDFISLFN